jgi:excisionase family DNA binding protein
VENIKEEKMTGLLNAVEATKFLKISRSTLYRWTSKRKIPHIKAGGRVLFRPSDLDQWLREKTVSPQR